MTGLVTVTNPVEFELLPADNARLGVCGDSVVERQVDRVHRSGIDMARAVVEGLSRHGGQHSFSTSNRDLGQLLEEQI